MNYDDIAGQYQATLYVDSVSVNMITFYNKDLKVMQLIMTCVTGSAYSLYSQHCINYSGTARGFGNKAVQHCSCSPLCKLSLTLGR